MKIDELSLFQADRFWENRKDNYGILVSAHIDVNEDIIDFNTNIRIEGDSFLDKLFNYLTITEKKRLVIFTRTKKEVGNENDIPDLETIKAIKDRCTNDGILFYNFIMNPFPHPILNFNLDDDEFALRFGFDSGCEIDKLAVSKDFCIDKKNHRPWHIVKNYIILITRKANYILDER